MYASMVRAHDLILKLFVFQSMCKNASCNDENLDDQAFDTRSGIKAIFVNELISDEPQLTRAAAEAEAEAWLHTIQLAKKAVLKSMGVSEVR